MPPNYSENLFKKYLPWSHRFVGRGRQHNSLQCGGVWFSLVGGIMAEGTWTEAADYRMVPCSLPRGI